MHSSCIAAIPAHNYIWMDRQVHNFRSTLCWRLCIGWRYIECRETIFPHPGNIVTVRFGKTESCLSSNIACFIINNCLAVDKLYRQQTVLILTGLDDFSKTNSTTLFRDLFWTYVLVSPFVKYWYIFVLMTFIRCFLHFSRTPVRLL